MTDVTDVLLENLRHAYARMERLVIVSLASALWLLVVANADPSLSRADAPDLELIGFSAEAPTFLSAAVAMIAYVVAGLLLALTERRSTRILSALRERSPDLATAAETHASVMALTPKWRIGCVFLVILPAVVAVQTLAIEPATKRWIVAIVLCFFHLVVIGQLFQTAHRRRQGSR